ncbi:MAG: hypothetical protein MIO93_12915 [ANME-2 cluster archaeon]|nr:hypothetical protein [ANME-2 cluster archaeon]
MSNRVFRSGPPLLAFTLPGCCTEELPFPRNDDGCAELDHCNPAGPAAWHYRRQHLGEGKPPLDPDFLRTRVMLWLAIVLVFPAITSFYTAWKASRLTVNEVLAYE